jgi:RNA polymerase sigma factor (sigma-70 family)
MTETRTVEILRRVEADSATDGELLAQFLRHDESAFTLIVRRHGPAVLDVCRRFTMQDQDAEDAFQAVFLLLAQKALSIRLPHSLGCWLYGAAVRISRRTQRSATRRRTHEVQVVNVPEPLMWPEERNPDLIQVVYEELAELPAHYREAILLCDLHGLSRADAARSLGIPEGTVSSRLAGGRKKLAARLARRGVVLSTTTIPTVLGSDFALASVPDVLESKTCALVAGWRAGATVPISVLRLTQGGVFMRGMLLFGMTCLALTAGAIYAAQQVDPPKPEASQPKTERPGAKEEAGAAVEKLKAEDKDVRLGAPQLRRAFDVGLSNAQDAVWSPDGSQLAVTGTFDKQGGVEVFSMTEDGKPKPTYRSFPRDPGEGLVGFTRDSKRVITELREYELISGFHKITFWEPSKEDAVFLRSTATVQLQPERTHFYAFALDGNSYRTVVSEERSIRTKIDAEPDNPMGLEAIWEREKIVKLQVREVSAKSGKTIRTLHTVEGEFDSFGLSGDGNWLAVGQADGVAVHGIPSGKKVFTPLKPSPINEPGNPRPRPATPMAFPATGKEPSRDLSVQISPYGNVILATRSSEQPNLISGLTGKLLPPLEDSESVMLFERQTCFSGDGRLLAVTGAKRTGNELFLRVWNTHTGKLLKSWPTKRVTIAFHPTKPILAILEPIDHDTRLGLWDFSAEASEEK